MYRFSNKLRHCFSSVPKYKQQLERHYKRNDYLQGHCNLQSSTKYANRNSKVHPQNWREPIGLTQKIKVSTLGIGTYNGEPSNQYDYQMFRALADTLLSGGVNVIDTCTLFRYGKSQKVINAVLNYLVKERGYSRQEFLVSTKCGYIPNDIDSNLKETDFIKTLTDDDIVKPEQIVNEIHCVHPNFLDFSVQKSRLGLGLQTIDVVYLNNFSEAHLPVVGQQKTYERLKSAFEKFEEMRTQNRIRYYGLSSFVGLRSPPTEEGVHFKLQKAIQIAKEVGGKDHGFRFLMVPFSLGTPEILLKWQQYTDSDGVQKAVRVFDIAERQDINIVSCGPLFAGRVANLPFQSKLLSYLPYNSAKHLQLIRSYFSPALLTTLVGQVQQSHLVENLSVLEHQLLSREQWRQILPIPDQ